jgi:hypothetical protein
MTHGLATGLQPPCRRGSKSANLNGGRPIVTMGFSCDDESTVNPQDELSVAASPICPVTHNPLFSTTPALGAPPLLI